MCKVALDAWWKLALIFSGGMLGLFLLGYETGEFQSCGYRSYCRRYGYWLDEPFPVVFTGDRAESL